MNIYLKQELEEKIIELKVRGLHNMSVRQFVNKAVEEKIKRMLGDSNERQ